MAFRVIGFLTVLIGAGISIWFYQNGSGGFIVPLILIGGLGLASMFFGRDKSSSVGYHEPNPSTFQASDTAPATSGQSTHQQTPREFHQPESTGKRVFIGAAGTVVGGLILSLLTGEIGFTTVVGVVGGGALALLGLSAFSSSS